MESSRWNLGEGDEVQEILIFDSEEGVLERNEKLESKTSFEWFDNASIVEAEMICVNKANIHYLPHIFSTRRTTTTRTIIQQDSNSDSPPPNPSPDPDLNPQENK